MPTETVEVNSALWQKIFASVVVLPFVGAGALCCVSPWLPIFSGPAPHPVLALALGLALGGLLFCFWWPVMHYSIRADGEGIAQFNGFFRQSIKWADVASYYLEQNSRFHSQRRLHVEPVMRNARGEIVFRGFAHILNSTGNIIEQRRELWSFAEARLRGKQIDKPFAPVDAEILAVQSFNDVDWATKSWAWKIARVAALVGCALLCLTLAMAPAYYVIVNSIQLGELSSLLLLAWTMTMIMAPLIVQSIRVKLKGRKINRDLQLRDGE